MKALLNRFKEPSSWAAVMGLLTSLGIQLPDGMAENITFVLAGLAGIAAIFIPEQKV
jgi:predicted permease